MAILQVNFLSQTLKRAVPIQVVLPSDKTLSYGGGLREKKLYQTLCLLHGLLAVSRHLCDFLCGRAVWM